VSRCRDENRTTPRPKTLPSPRGSTPIVPNGLQTCRELIETEHPRVVRGIREQLVEWDLVSLGSALVAAGSGRTVAVSAPWPQDARASARASHRACVVAVSGRRHIELVFACTVVVSWSGLSTPGGHETRAASALGRAG
jgi:hypothetical protein